MAELGLIPNAALHLKVAARPRPPESLVLQTSSGAAGGLSAILNLGITQVSSSTSNSLSMSAVSQATTTHHSQTTTTSHQSTTVPSTGHSRRVPSPALQQIPPNLHPDLPPTPVPLLCFPDSHDTTSDRDS